MANIEVTLKRYNGTTNDELFPTTTMAQVQVSTSDTTSISDYLVTNYINTNKLGVASGVATLNSSGKITSSQLPEYVFGGLEYRGTLSATQVNSDGKIASLLHAIYQNNDSNIGSIEGAYWILSETVTLSDQTSTSIQAGTTGYYYTWSFGNPSEESDTSSPFTLESGDWLVVSAYDAGDGSQGAPFYINFGIINNTYQDATSAVKGIVTLSSATDTTGTTSKVVTESVLGGLIGTTANTIAAGDHLHDGRYYTETEIQAFFAGTSSITGYNDDNWNTAYSEKINSTSFNTTSGVLTLTRQDNTTLTVDLDGRYAESVAVAQTDSTDGLDVSVTGDTYTLKHHDTSSIANVSNTNGNVIQSATFDTFGHMLTATSVDLDGRYYTETEINNWINGTATLNSNQYVQILYGASPTSTIAGTILIDED